MHKFPLQRFIPLNLLSVLIWTIFSCMGGYFLRDVMQDILSFDLIQKYLILGLGAGGLILSGYFIWEKDPEIPIEN